MAELGPALRPLKRGSLRAEIEEAEDAAIGERVGDGRAEARGTARDSSTVAIEAEDWSSNERERERESR
jgi:hypothetical protein